MTYKFMNVDGIGLNIEFTLSDVFTFLVLAIYVSRDRKHRPHEFVDCLLQVNEPIVSPTFRIDSELGRSFDV